MTEISRRDFLGRLGRAFLSVGAKKVLDLAVSHSELLEPGTVNHRGPEGARHKEIIMGEEFAISEPRDTSAKEGPLILAIGKKTEVGEDFPPIIAGWQKANQTVFTMVHLDDRRVLSPPMIEVPHHVIDIPLEFLVNVVNPEDYREKTELNDRVTSPNFVEGLFSSLLADYDGRFLLFYSKFIEREKTEVFFQTLTADLSLADKERSLGEPTEGYSYQLSVKAANSPNGTKLVVWTEVGNVITQPESRPIVAGRFLDSNNQYVGEPFIIFAKKYSQAPQVIYDEDGGIFWVTSMIPYLGYIGGEKRGFYAELFVKGVSAFGEQIPEIVITGSAKEDIRSYTLSKNPYGSGWQVVWDEWSRIEPSGGGVLVGKISGGRKKVLLSSEEYYLTTPRVAPNGLGLVYAELSHLKDHSEVFFTTHDGTMKQSLATPSNSTDARTSSLPVIAVLPSLKEDFSLEKRENSRSANYITVFRRGSGTYFLDSPYVHGRLVTVNEHVDQSVLLPQYLKKRG